MREVYRWWLPFLLLILLLTGVYAPLAAQDESTFVQHPVLPGDTWAALAWRYGLTEADLARLRPLNTQRQPVIGTILSLPERGVNRAGTLVRGRRGGLLETAVRHNTTPWQLALQNQHPHPYYPQNYQPLFVPGGDAAPRDLPLGFSDLAFSQVPARPGTALGVRGMATRPLSPTVALAGEGFASFQNGRYHLSLGGTGAFFGSQDPELTIHPAPDVPLWSQPWRFVEDEWDFEEITLTGSAAQIDRQSILEERERLFKIWNQATPTLHLTTPFGPPLESYVFVSSNYGARRSYNGGPYDRYHEGMDFAAYGGTPVLAVGQGTVVIAETLFVRGGTVIIDHGLGIYTGYYHMSNVLVNVGDQVQGGQIVGEVGTTGLSTGNHLHWDLLVNGVWVDAASWQEQGMGCWLLAGWGTPCGGTGGF